MAEEQKKPTADDVKQQLVNKYAFIGFKKHVIKLEEQNIENALKEVDALDKEFVRLSTEEQKAKEA